MRKHHTPKSTGQNVHAHAVSKNFDKIIQKLTNFNEKYVSTIKLKNKF
jgi:hypothetical protein